MNYTAEDLKDLSFEEQVVIIERGSKWAFIKN